MRGPEPPICVVDLGIQSLSKVILEQVPSSGSTEIRDGCTVPFFRFFFLDFSFSLYLIVYLI